MDPGAALFGRPRVWVQRDPHVNPGFLGARILCKAPWTWWTQGPAWWAWVWRLGAALISTPGTWVHLAYLRVMMDASSNCDGSECGNRTGRHAKSRLAVRLRDQTQAKGASNLLGAPNKRVAWGVMTVRHIHTHTRTGTHTHTFSLRPTDQHAHYRPFYKQGYSTCTPSRMTHPHTGTHTQTNTHTHTHTHTHTPSLPQINTHDRRFDEQGYFTFKDRWLLASRSAASLQRLVPFLRNVTHFTAVSPVTELTPPYRPRKVSPCAGAHPTLQTQEGECWSSPRPTDPGRWVPVTELTCPTDPGRWVPVLELSSPYRPRKVSAGALLALQTQEAESMRQNSPEESGKWVTHQNEERDIVEKEMVRTGGKKGDTNGRGVGKTEGRKKRKREPKDRVKQMHARGQI